MPPLEERERLACKEIYEMAGCVVVNLSQRQRSMQTRGIADLMIFDHKSGTWWYHEVKRLQGDGYRKTAHPQTPDQVWFQGLVEEFGIEYVLGARDAALAKLRRMGRIE